jgi:pilus assembly protein Flp/PilA
MQNLLKCFLRDEGGATAIEYGLLVAVIAVVIVGAAIIVGTNLSSLFSEIAACLEGTTAATCAFS